MQYDFQGRNDLVKFVKTVAEAGLYVHLRIGPYVCAEWNYGCGEFLDFLSLFFISLEVREDSSNLPRLTKKTCIFIILRAEASLFGSILFLESSSGRTTSPSRFVYGMQGFYRNS